MKLFTATFFTASLVALHALVAQDASTVPVPDNNPPPSSELPLAPSSPTPAPLFPTDNPPPIVNKPPHNGNGGGGSSTAGSKDRNIGGFQSNTPGKKQLTTSESVQSVADNIKYREAKTKALRDPKVQEAQDVVDTATNDHDKRAALKKYYTTLSDRILKIDGSIKKLVAERLKASLNQLDQSKVRPGEYPQQASAGH